MPEFCHAIKMLRPILKIFAVLMAIWLPLFSGSALAASVTMQLKIADCHLQVVHQEEYFANPASSVHHHELQHNDQSVASLDQQSGNQDKHNASCKDCSVCHFACSGYLAAAAIKSSEPQVSSQKYSVSSTRFNSYTSAPLDPPPLSRV